MIQAAVPAWAAARRPPEKTGEQPPTTQSTAAAAFRIDSLAARQPNWFDLGESVCERETRQVSVE